MNAADAPGFKNNINELKELSERKKVFLIAKKSVEKEEKLSVLLVLLKEVIFNYKLIVLSIDLIIS